jgi:hypothetical protein
LDHHQQQQQPENATLMINNDQNLDKLADGKAKDSVVATSGKKQQHQQQSNATNQTSVGYKPLYQTVPVHVPITAHVISEHLAPHPQGQHPGPATKTTVNNKLSFIPNSANAINQHNHYLIFSQSSPFCTYLQSIQILHTCNLARK